MSQGFINDNFAVPLPLAVASGGTGSATAATARAALSAAQSGANTDITSLTSVSLLDEIVCKYNANPAIAGRISLYEASNNGVNFVRISANTTLGSSIDFTWPNSAGTVSYPMITDGGGGLSFAVLPIAGGGTGATTAIAARTALAQVPTSQLFITGSGTYTTPANCLYITVEAIGGGGGGGASGVTPATGTTGGATTFSTLTCNGGVGGVGEGAGGVGGTVAGSTLPIQGGTGENGQYQSGASVGGSGGQGAFGGGGSRGTGISGAVAGITNTGGGGGGSAGDATNNSSGGGGSGGYGFVQINTPAATYSYAVGAGGAGASASVQNGAAGGSGVILVREFYI